MRLRVAPRSRFGLSFVWKRLGGWGQAKRHPGEILLVNASKRFEKRRPKNFLAEENIDAITAVFRRWEADEALSAVVPLGEAARNDFNLSPSRYVHVDEKTEALPVEDALVLLAEAEEERQMVDAEKQLDSILAKDLPGLNSALGSKKLPTLERMSRDAWKAKKQGSGGSGGGSAPLEYIERVPGILGGLTR